jgi:hypothetical protein
MCIHKYWKYGIKLESWKVCIWIHLHFGAIIVRQTDNKKQSEMVLKTHAESKAHFDEINLQLFLRVRNRQPKKEEDWCDSGLFNNMFI